MWERLFGLDGQLLFDALILSINIFVIFMVLSYVLFNPVREFLEKRKSKITGEISDAKQKQMQADKVLKQYEHKLQGAKKEVEDILEQSKEDAAKNKEVIMIDAKEEADKIIQRGTDKIMYDKQKVRGEIKQSAIQSAELISKKILEGVITYDENVRLVDEAIEKVSQESVTYTLPEIEEAEEEEIEEAEEVSIPVKIMTAFPLDDRQKSNLKNNLSQIEEIEKFYVNYRVDKNIIAGAVIFAGNTLIDNSIKGRLDKMLETIVE